MTKPISKIRNIGIIAHIDAGKTTTTERILFYSGKTHRIGQVDEGSTITDFMAQERERGITITSAAITTTWRDTVTGEEDQINIIDTPGHIDFTAEVQRSLRVLDGGIVIFDAVAGVEPQSETVWHQADGFGVPRICFINKMDRVGANLERTLKMIEDRLGANPVLLQLPIGTEDNFEGMIDLIRNKAIYYEDKLGINLIIKEIPKELKTASDNARWEMLEKIAETDETLTDKFLHGSEISEKELYRALREAVIKNQIIPVFIGSALRNKGIQPLLDAIVRYLPSPLEVPPVEGVDPIDGTEYLCYADPSDPFCAMVFKVVSDPYVGRLTFIRVYSGRLEAGRKLYNANRDIRERASRLLLMQADKRKEIAACQAGDIVAVVGFKESFTGETLCESEDYPLLLESIKFPDPVIKIAIEPESQIKTEEEKLVKALNKLSDEDPTFRTYFDSESRQIIISGMGELHLEIIVDRIRREFGVMCKTGTPEVAYRETITKKAKGKGAYIHQSGGAGRFAVVYLEISPNQPGEGFTFEHQISGGTLTTNYISATEKGVREALEEGLLAGYPVVDVHVNLVDGKMHEVDSHKRDFEFAGSIGFKEAYKTAKPILLEPIMRVETIVLEAHMGNITKDFARRRGNITNIEMRSDKLHTVRAMVPLSEMLGYATDLRSMTSARGSFTMELDHYQPLDQELAKAIIERKRDPF